MKRILFVLFLFLPVISFAQKVNVVTDDFTGESIVTTSWEKIYSGGLSGKFQTRVRFRHEHSKDFMEFRIFNNDVASCDKDQVIMLKTDNGVISVFNMEYTISKHGDWHPQKINNNLGIYIICKGNEMERLNNEIVKKIRVTLSGEYFDLELSRAESALLKKMYHSFSQKVKE